MVFDGLFYCLCSEKRKAWKILVEIEETCQSLERKMEKG